MPKLKNTKIHATVELDNQPLTQLTKIEIAPIIGKGCYAITLRFALTDSFAFPPSFKDGCSSKLSYTHPNLPKSFKFDVEYLDMGLESNSQFSELTVFLRGRKMESKPVLVSMPDKQLIL